MHVQRLSRGSGIEVRSIDLSTELDDGTFAQLEQLFNSQSLIVFRDQSISRVQGRHFFARFGPRVEGIETVSNQAVTGQGELQYHSERSFQRGQLIRGLALYGKEISPGGGATLFIDCGAAYRSLPEALHPQLTHANTVHSFDPRVRLGANYAGPDVPEGGWQTIHPAILHHPITGAPILFVSPWFTSAIVGLDEERGTALL
jgi:taurine dioxygenase